MEGRWRRSLETYHVFADSTVFKQQIYCLFLRMEGVEGVEGGGAQNWSFLVVVVNAWALTLVWNGNGLNRMLFGMPVSRYALNKKSFRILERSNRFKYLLYFYILQRNDKKMEYEPKKRSFPWLWKGGLLWRLSKIATSHHQWRSTLELFYEAIMTWENIWKYPSIVDERLSFWALHSVPWF